MKNIIYKIVVDVWRLAAKYDFRKMRDDEWETFVAEAENLVRRYRDAGDAVERLCRNLFGAFQEFYQQKGKE